MPMLHRHLIWTIIATLLSSGANADWRQLRGTDAMTDTPWAAINSYSISSGASLFFKCSVAGPTFVAITFPHHPSQMHPGMKIFLRADSGEVVPIVTDPVVIGRETFLISRSDSPLDSMVALILAADAKTHVIIQAAGSVHTFDAVGIKKAAQSMLQVCWPNMRWNK